MIMPAELAVHPEQLVHLFEELEAFILGDISRRVAKTGELTATAQIQTRVLRELGGDLMEVKKRVAETTKLAAGVADKMFNDVIMESFDRERTTFGLAGKSLSFSTAKYNILQASVKDIRGQFLSMTGSIGMAGSPLEEAYHKAVNTAYLQVSTGASDYVSAIKRQVKTLAADGLQLVNYDKHNDHADVAVRRAVVTGLADATQKISMLNAQELGAELVEVSAHAGARPDHAEWQGRVYSLATANKKYPDFYRATGYGTGGGLGGYNCRHSFFAFFEGMTTQWTEEQLANIDGKPFVCTLDGKTYTAWEAAQKQRSIERAIRQTKREILGYAEAGDKDAELIARLKLQEQMEVYEQFSGEAGLLLQKERLGVISVKPGGAVTVNKLDKSVLLKDTEDKNLHTNGTAKITQNVFSRQELNTIFAQATSDAKEMAEVFDTNASLQVISYNGKIGAVAETFTTEMYGEKVVRLLSIASTGAQKGAGKELLANIFSQAQESDFGVSFKAVGGADKYYDNIGLVEFRVAQTKAYFVPAAKVKTALQKLRA